MTQGKDISMFRKSSIGGLGVSTFVILLFTVLSSVHFAEAQIPELVLTVPDTTMQAGQTGALLNIYMDNYFDTIAGFQFVLVSERPDLLLFNFDHGGFDTTGTLVSGFEYVQSINRAGDRSEIWFRCIANLPFDTVHNWGFPPQQGGVAVRIPVNISSNPNPDSGLTSILSITTPVDFSDPWGRSIGVVTVTIYDTTYYLCNLWQNDTCLEWIEVDPDSSGYDSIYVDTSLYGYLDTTVVILNDGSVTVELPDWQCDYDGNGRINVVDVTFLVQCLFGMPPPEVCENVTCDPNGSGSLNVADLTYLVDYLFRGGPPPM
jgi:hypothetical protein